MEGSQSGKESHAVITISLLIGFGFVVFVVVLFVLWRFFSSQEKSAGNVTPAATTTTDGADPLRLDEQTGETLDARVSHTWTHGHYLARACELAYRDAEPGAAAYLAELNLQSRLISRDNTQVWVCENANSIVLAFRGSQSPTSIDGFKDWLLTNARNFLVLPEGEIGTDFAAAGVGARFHRGFMGALAEIWDPLLAGVEQALQRGQRPVWVTGHSLGGAIALLAAWRLHRHFVPVHEICTFGAPMTGNAAAAEAYHREFPGKIVRYVDYSDMVPKLPTMSLLSNQYGHVQREVVVGTEAGAGRSAEATMSLAADQHPEGDMSEVVADNLWHELNSGISAHLMDNYILRLSEQLG